jgi:hypothetical protein
MLPLFAPTAGRRNVNPRSRWWRGTAHASYIVGRDEGSTEPAPQSRLGSKRVREVSALGVPLGRLGFAFMSGIIARVLVILFGLSLGCGVVRQMIWRHRNAKTARRQLVNVDSSTQ